MTDRVNASQKLYNRIAVLRAEHGLARGDLSDALSVSYQTIGYMERGDYNPSLELAFRVAEFFGLPIEAVFSRTPFRPMSEELYGERATPPAEPARPAKPEMPVKPEKPAPPENPDKEDAQ